MKLITESFFNELIKTVTNPLPGSTAYSTLYKLPVKKKYEGLNIVDFFTKLVPRANKEIWLEKIKNQTLLINNKPATTSTIVKGGDITQHTSQPREEPWVNTKIGLLYSDEDILIINKPAPLPMHPSGRFNKNTLTQILKLAFPNEDLKIIHRLDANTTGIVILGRNKEVVQKISKQFENKSIQKTYLALVENIADNNYFNTNLKIGLNKTVGGGRESSKDGIDAYTEFKVLERFPSKNTTLLEVIPHTGRTNQIRLHLTNLNHPIVGDHGYKDIHYFKTNPLTYSTDCLFLHAWKLNFEYNNISFLIEAPIPSKFKK